jgi:hypothetical protein
MQETLWPIKRLQAKDFAIYMLFFEYVDYEDGSALVRCQGRLVDFMKESADKHVHLKIECSDKCVERWRSKDHQKSTEKDEMEFKPPSWRGMARGFLS